MSKSNEGANMSFRGMSRPLSLYPRRESNIIRHLRVTERGEVDNYLYVKRGITVGGVVRKDMDSENYTQEFDPFSLQNTLFPGMADFVDANILQGGKESGDRLNASYWSDLGNDVFDDWGYFFLYDVQAGKYFFPILSPINQADGVMTTQSFNTGFGELNFTITHGWRAKGIFMMNISCSDENFAFRFGAYGNLGSDGDEDDYDMTAKYGVTGKTLYYHHHAEQGDDQEILYSYFVPYNDVDNAVKPYASLYSPENTDDNSLITKSVTNGIKVYFSKENDVKDWVITDLLDGDLALVNGDIKADGNVLIEGNVSVLGDMVSRGYNLGKRNLLYMNNNEDYTADSSIVESYYISQGLSNNRTFYIPSADVMAGAITNFQQGTSFRVTINNMANIESGFSWNLNFGNNVSGQSLKSSSVGPGCIVTYIVILYNDEGVYATFLQEGETAQII